MTRTVYVVDTSVLLADPLAVTRFAEHEVVLPLVVLTELEGKRHHPELGGRRARASASSRNCAPATGRCSSRCR
jgi:predicted ribonuclease YlaK